MNVSIDNIKTSQIDYVKLVLLCGDVHVLSMFNRLGSKHCVAALNKINSTVKGNAELREHFMTKLKNALDNTALELISQFFKNTQKNTSIHMHNSYVEFRAPGNDWLDMNIYTLSSTIARFITALDAACDPNKYRNEYLKKLYMLLNQNAQAGSTSSNTTYAKYLAGQISRDELKELVKDKKQQSKWAQ